VSLSRFHLGLLAAALVGCAPRTGPITEPIAVPGVRVVDRSGQTSSFDALVGQAAHVDVVFFGEQHDDPETHRVEFGLLDALGRTGRPIILSLEMFERDVQPLLDAYLAGTIPESEFLAKARPWDRYVTDYRPMVELARSRGWPVIASNVPRPMASAVGRAGLACLDTIPATARAFAATEIQCPDDAYRARFLQEMRGHSSGGAAPSAADTLPTAAAQRYYLAQCVKDETMAESIARALDRGPAGALLVHYNGAFHSDFGQGTADRVRRRRPEGRTLLVTAVPTTDLDAATAVQVGRADWVVFTRRIAPRQPPARER
jgi:uncharacterized iron-regulated protein